MVLPGAHACPCRCLTHAQAAHDWLPWPAGGRDWQRCSWRCSRGRMQMHMADGTTLGCVIVDAVARWGLTSVAARTWLPLAHETNREDGFRSPSYHVLTRTWARPTRRHGVKVKACCPWHRRVVCKLS